MSSTETTKKAVSHKTTGLKYKFTNLDLDFIQ